MGARGVGLALALAACGAAPAVGLRLVGSWAVGARVVTGQAVTGQAATGQAADAPAGQASVDRASTLAGEVDRAYLPRLDVRAPGATTGTFADVPCPMVADACLPSGWGVRCGGIGRVRDLLVARTPSGGAAQPGAPFSAIVAVGDGAAVGVPDGNRVAWTVATGVDLGGLNHVAAGIDGGHWAVGDGARIARRADTGAACWSIVASSLPTSSLLSLELKATLGSPPFGSDPWPPGIGGWAVGRALSGTGSAARMVGMVAQLDIDRTPPLWRHLTRDGDRALDLPPLSDIQVVPASGGGQQIWAIGQEGDTGVLARMQTVDGQATWRVDRSVALEGHPEELVMRSDRRGWAFGHTSGAMPAAAIWSLDAGRWGPRPRPQFPGQSMIDAYMLDFTTVSYGLTPAATDAPGGRDVIRRAEGAGDWRTVARWPADVPLPARGGHRALAPVGSDRYLYALGDGLWLVDARAETTGWDELWRRHDLHAFAGDADGGWMLADVEAADGPALLAIDRGRIRRWQPDTPLPRLRALAQRLDTAWAVGDDGATWWLPAGVPTWRPAPADGTAAGDLLALAATANGALWAAGADRDGHGQVWRLSNDRWEPIPMPPALGPLTAIAATNRGNAWAIGGMSDAAGAMVFFRPAPPLPGRCPADRPWRRAADLCVLSEPSRSADVTATGDDTLWLARVRDIVERGIDTSFRYLDLGIRGADGDCPGQSADEPCKLPPTCRLTAIAAAHPSAVWAAAVCSPDPDDPSRGATRLLHWNGASWRLATVVNTPIHRLVAGTAADGTPWVWAVGDWTTVLHFAGR